jgi:hypothetical protein
MLCSPSSTVNVPISAQQNVVTNPPQNLLREAETARIQNYFF